MQRVSALFIAIVSVTIMTGCATTNSAGVTIDRDLVNQCDPTEMARLARATGVEIRCEIEEVEHIPAGPAKANAPKTNTIDTGLKYSTKPWMYKDCGQVAPNASKEMKDAAVQRSYKHLLRRHVLAACNGNSGKANTLKSAMTSKEGEGQICLLLTKDPTVYCN